MFGQRFSSGRGETAAYEASTDPADGLGAGLAFVVGGPDSTEDAIAPKPSSNPNPPRRRHIA